MADLVAKQGVNREITYMGKFLLRVMQSTPMGPTWAMAFGSGEGR